MIRVFVYHNQPRNLELLHKAMTEYFQKRQHTFCLTVYSQYREAIQHLNGTGKDDDLFFIDFTDFKKGIQLAGCLREKNSRAFWVYMDGAQKNLYQSMILQPSAYIPDSMDSRELLMTLQRLEKYHQMVQQKFYFNFKCEGEYMRIPFEKISYFESSAKKVTLRLIEADKRYYFTAKLDDIASQMPVYFLRCHQSYLVNMHMIKSLDVQNHVFFLHTNEEIFISRRSFRETKEKYQKFMEGRP